MKLSDFVVKFLVEKGISDIFLVSGGGIMHLLDSVGRNKNIHYYCNYHEQACAISAEGYARAKNGVGACLVTTGPGGANALSGIPGAWVESIPVLVISGQVRRDLIADYSKLRQTGPQEGNIISMAQPVTKYAQTIMDPQQIRYELEFAFCKATSGRPGPVWLDIPLDVQASQVDEARLVSYDPQGSKQSRIHRPLVSDIKKVIEVITTSKRPILICGNGIHLSHSEDLLRRLIERMQIPVVLPYSAKDLVPEDHPMYVGVFGTSGQRRANFAIQNADCVISLAAGLNCTKVGFNYKGFAPRAKKIIVDIDEGQLLYQALRSDQVIASDIRVFLEELLHHMEKVLFKPSRQWLEACTRWKQQYPIIIREFYRDSHHVHTCVFMDKLSQFTSGSDVLVTGNGFDSVSYYQAFKVKRGQRTMLNANWGAMGWDLPAAIGACIGSGKRRTICVTGDGSIQWNIQELLTIRHYDLPIKIFVFNNRGYSCIRATQKNFFEGRYVGADRTSGVDNPDFEKLAAAYRIDYARIQNNAEVEEGLARFLLLPGPALCEVNISSEQEIIPKASAYKKEDGTFESRPLEDMFPFLPREELWENMHLFEEDSN